MSQPTGDATSTGKSPLTRLIEDCQRDLEQTEKELKEMDILIRQSSAEVEKLAQRNAQFASKVRQVEMNIDTYPRADIMEIFSAAQDAQTRLFMMRGQMEQLQTKQRSLQKHAELLKRVLEAGRGVSPRDLPTVRQPSPGGADLIAQIIEAQEDERRRLARQMHDGPAQSLTNLILQAEVVERLYDKNPEGARGELGNLKNAVNATFQQIRDFIFDLRPMMLDDLGLIPTLRKYAQAFEGKTGVATNLSLVGKERRLPSHTEVIVFRGIQALLDNVQRHATASHAQINLDIRDDQVSVSIEDNGSGFSPQEVLQSPRPSGRGLVSLRERIRMLGGDLEVESGIGRGTRVRFYIPYRA
ncbi:MAG: sensor histidine kinase [Anaerolineae bacterium]